MDHLAHGRHSAERSRAEYAVLPGFAAVNLEGSRVVDIVAQPGMVTVYLDAALLPDHPDFRSAREGSEFDFASARVIFDHVSDLTWAAQRRPGERDTYGNLDHGQVHTFEMGHGLFELAGDFGVITVRGFDCRLSLLEDVSAPAGGSHRGGVLGARHSS